MTVTSAITKPVPDFHELVVKTVDRIIEDAVAITFDVPDELRDRYAFAPGQHLTIRRFEDGQEIRRSYSICSSPLSGQLRVAVKSVPDGVFSSYALNSLRAGDSLDVMAPAGTFTTALDPQRSRHYALIAAGSGITPILSLAAAALEVEPQSRVTLVFGNRSTSTIMFLEEIADLKDTYADRFQWINVLSREVTPIEMLSGRIDPERMATISEALLPLDDVDDWFLCGPFEMVTGVRDWLVASGAPAKSVHFELFHVEAAPRPRKERAAVAAAEDLSKITIILGGLASSFDLERDTVPILDAALEIRGDLPFACKGGVCGTCRCKIIEGEVEMDVNYALEPDELDRGIRLACQSHPLTDTVTVDFDI
ncbi:MAG: 1,2-phenylacetyl-CoA epoxidase subunit PaaE [Antricoccus sp.]